MRTLASQLQDHTDLDTNYTLYVEQCQAAKKNPDPPGAWIAHSISAHIDKLTAFCENMAPVMDEANKRRKVSAGAAA